MIQWVSSYFLNLHAIFFIWGHNLPDCRMSIGSISGPSLTFFMWNCEKKPTNNDKFVWVFSAPLRTISFFIQWETVVNGLLFFLIPQYAAPYIKPKRENDIRRAIRHNFKQVINVPVWLSHQFGRRASHVL